MRNETNVNRHKLTLRLIVAIFGSIIFVVFMPWGYIMNVAEGRLQKGTAIQFNLELARAARHAFDDYAFHGPNVQDSVLQVLPSETVTEMRSVSESTTSGQAKPIERSNSMTSAARSELIDKDGDTLFANFLASESIATLLEHRCPVCGARCLEVSDCWKRGLRVFHDPAVVSRPQRFPVFVSTGACQHWFVRTRGALVLYVEIEPDMADGRTRPPLLWCHEFGVQSCAEKVVDCGKLE